MKPLVAVIGRPNVGKSTFVNKLVGERYTIVDNIPGVTRDRLYLDVEWLRYKFTVIDTGGIIPDETDDILKSVQKQTKLAIDEADVIVFITDGRDGVTSVDKEIAVQLHKTKKPVVLVVNKIDNDKLEINSSEFFELNLGIPNTISAIHGTGINTVLDNIVQYIPVVEEENNSNIKIAIVGKPNVGKSSIVNAILGKERMIVSDVPGTTRDAIDSVLRYYGKEYLLIDTAGIRKKSKISYGVELFSVLRSFKAIERADIVLLVISAEEGVTEQEKKLAGFIEEKGKPCIIIINKWDLVKNKTSSTQNEYTKNVRKDLYFINYAPLLFTSALTKKRLFDVFKMIDNIIKESNKRISTGLLNKVINESVALNPPSFIRGKSARIYYSTQVIVNPPTFILFVNNKDLFQESYKRYLENKLRESFGFEGTPIRIIFRNKEKN
jgi:GTP-binding protein